MVATTRPETLLGDTAVAINPKDKRYQNLVGKKVLLPIAKRKIPIIADNRVNPKFGTGAIKVTPAHDAADYQIGLRHNLPLVQVINEKGEVRGMKVGAARQKIVEELKKQGLLVKAEDYTHQVPQCYRCQTTVELIPSEQWFLKMGPLAKTALQAVKSGKVKFAPKKWEKIYLDWLKNVKDWCISRQLWWGHKIPLKGETDVLDTWFSSALWPFATLGWPKKTKDLKIFYPTDVLSTARDIINFWVARMVFSGIEFMGRPPFSTVLIHPTILTKEGKRMSKSLGTGVDPINLIEKYGADATRFGLAYQLMGGQDIRFVEDNIIMGKKFCNKLWNASRFILKQTTGENKYNSLSFSSKKAKGPRDPSALTQFIVKRLNQTINSVNRDLENYRFGRAAHTLYDFFWHDFCDKYIEDSKKYLYSNLRSINGREKEKMKREIQTTLIYVLLASLKLLHPFIPFITEEIYQKLPLKNKKKTLMIEPWMFNVGH